MAGVSTAAGILLLGVAVGVESGVDGQLNTGISATEEKAGETAELDGPCPVVPRTAASIRSLIGLPILVIVCCQLSVEENEIKSQK